MIISNACSSQIHAPVRTIKARVELLEGSTLINQFCYRDALKSFTIDRTGEGKFFGFGICQRLNVHLRDTKREFNVSTANTIDVSFGAGCEYIYPLPNFYVSEVHRDEETNELSITAYDALYRATEHTVSELEIEGGYTIRAFATACAALLGLPMIIIADNEAAFDTFYEAGANFEGTETIRSALNAVAEATQTVYYVDNNWNLTFKKLDINGEPVATIDKERYFTLKSGDNRRLATIFHATELGDNVSASATFTGSTQYVRDNPFWDLRDDIGALVDNALAAVSGLTINQFDCSWRGNFLIEIGDKIAFITKDNKTVYTYFLNDAIKYDGTYSQETKWHYDENDGETPTNPTSLGDALKQTYARVDKANQQIELVVSNTNGTFNSINGELEEINSKVSATVSKDDFEILFNEKISNGVSSVETSTGFTFNDEGLTVSKSNSNISTTITEDGMTIKKGGNDVLTADNEGVKAIDLHATTYLIIGKYSRFEDYPGKNRTACFWIGG
jgi:hypothetical protein